MNSYSATSSLSRNRRGQSQPVYTSDKRAKFTQRENKKWIRFLTVLGYIFFVSLPALSFSVYYIYMWDPGYMSKFPHNESHGEYPVMYVDTIKSDRAVREVSHLSSLATPQASTPLDPVLAEILRQGANSMESSAELTNS